MRSASVIVALILTACSSASSTDAESSDSDYTAARPEAAPGDVPPYTDADKPFEYGARVRVSYAGGAVSESEETASHTTVADAAMPWTLGVGRTPAGRALFLSFGTAKAKAFDVGTYACADGDAMIYEAEWDAEGHGSAQGARECHVVIDRIVAGPSDDYARAFGRFDAKSAAPDGLSTDLAGTFLADFPIVK